MKSAARVLYTIGRVFNIIGMVFSVLFTIFGALVLAFKEQIADQAAKDNITALNDVKEVQILGIILLVLGIIYIIIEILVFVLATKASKKLKEGSTEVWPHVLMLVIGFFGDFFYFLGGIFGIVSCDSK